MLDLNELVFLFQNKNEKAFEKLYNMYSTNIQGVIFNIVKNKAIADEIMQDSFVKAWQNSTTYSSKKGRFYTWILNIARNAAIDRLRSKAFKQTRQNLNMDNLENSLHSLDNLDQRTNTIGVLKFITKLSFKRREIIELLFLKGFTHKEASVHLNIPLGTVKTRSRDGIKSLRILAK